MSYNYVMEILTRRDLFDRWIQRVKPEFEDQEKHSIGTNTTAGFKLSRRDFLVVTTSAMLVGCSTNQQPLPVSRETGLPTSERFSSPELHRLGQELKDWTLTKGVRMYDRFSDVKKVADLLTGDTDPRIYNSFVQPPLKFSTDTHLAEYNTNFETNRSDPRTIDIIDVRNRQITQYEWVHKVRASFSLSPEVLQSSARLPILVKEVIQFTDFMEYDSFYLDLFKKSRQDLVIRLNNPRNLSTNERDQAINTFFALRNYERRNFGYSTLADFLDGGSGLIAAPILGNWLLDQERQGLVAPNVYWSQVLKGYVDFMHSEGFLIEEDGVLNWKDNSPPNIASLEFYKLFGRFIEKTLPNRKPLITA